MGQINIKTTPEIENILDIIKKDTGFGVTTLFNQLVMNEYNHYYRHKSLTINNVKA